MKGFFRTHWPIIFLALISISLCITNYTPNTFLSGWDTLHPEFNFPLNIKRAISGVFRTEQGLGAVAGHSHMADLPRILTLFGFSFFLPLDFLRYSYIFLMLIIGPIGMYLFLYKTALKEKTSSFLGALFYLFNLGTMQIFVVPFEMFVVQYGFFPWLMLFATAYLQSGMANRKILFIFCLTTLLATPVAYAATLWHVQFVFFVLYIALFTFLSFKEFPGIKKRAVILVITTLFINAFWLLPNLYFALNHGQEVSNANINQLFSPQAFLYNKEFGNAKDIALLKTFLFDWNAYNSNNQFDYLLKPWIAHLKRPYVEQIGLLLASISLLGLLYGIGKRQKIAIAFIPGFALCLFLLINDNPPTGWLYKILQNTIPLFKETLRFPENKALGLFVFLMAFYFGFLQLAIIQALSRLPIISTKIVSIIQTSIIVFLLFFFMLPAFQGNLISPLMRIQIPKEYFLLFDWLNKQQDDGRVANLPIHSFWGWEYYDWYGKKVPSFQGAGFLWFGFKQPLLHRDFDRWTPYNEQYYKEMSYAIYTQNPTLLASVLKKYNIHYLLLDKSMIAPQADQKILFYKEIEQILAKLAEEKVVQKDDSFGNFLSVYSVNPSITQTYTSSLKTAINLYPKTQSMYEDFAYLQYGDYITKENGGIYMPFLSLVQNTGEFKHNIQITTEGLVIKEPLGKNLTLVTPSYLDSQQEIPAEFVAERLTTNELRIAFYPYSLFQGIFYPPIIINLPLPKALLDNQSLDATLSLNQKDNFPLGTLTKNQPSSLGKILLKTNEQNTIMVYDKHQPMVVTPDFTVINYTLSPCDPTQSSDSFGINISQSKNGFTIFGTDIKLCTTIPLNALPQLASLIEKNESLMLNMHFSYNGETHPDVCIVRLDTGGCVKNLVNSSFAVFPSDLSSLGIKFTFDTSIRPRSPATPFGVILNRSKQKGEITYENISFSITKSVASKVFSNDELKALLQPIKKITGQNPIAIPLLTTEEFSKDITLTQTDATCKSQSAKEGTNKKNLVKKDGKEYIEYISEEGSLCDYFSYPNLLQNKAYAIAITSKHISGLPLTMCISNPTSKRCDVYANLPVVKEPTISLFLLPPMSQDKIGFTVDINNFAIKKTPSINQLYNIQVIPFPYTWITGIVSEQKENPKQINNILTLSYSFEKGWKAYKVFNDNLFTNIFPFLFGEEVKDHVLVNNWANGWILEENGKLVIIFLPQYLQYLGFILLFGAFGWLGLTYRRGI